MRKCVVPVLAIVTFSATAVAQDLEGQGDERPGRPDFSAMRDEIFEQVAEILNEDQWELLADYWAPIESGMRSRGQRETDDFRIVLLAAKRVRQLSREQKEEWRAVMREAMRSFRDVRRTDEQRRAALDAEVKSRVLELLDKGQEKEFERNLERLKSRQSRAPRNRAERSVNGEIASAPE